MSDTFSKVTNTVYKSAQSIQFWSNKPVLTKSSLLHQQKTTMGLQVFANPQIGRYVTKVRRQFDQVHNILIARMFAGSI